MKRIIQLLLTVPVVLSAFACVDRDPVDPDVVVGPQFAFIDKKYDGFFFFSPLGGGVSGATLVGTEAPTVDICVAGSSCEGSNRIAHFTRTSAGTGGAQIGVSAENAYQVDWNTRFTDGATITLMSVTYQVVVRLNDELLGTADIRFYANPGQAKKAPADVFPVLLGRTLPVKFGFDLTVLMDLGIAGDDFVVETFTTTEGGTAVIPDEAAFHVDGGNVQMPPGFEGQTEFKVLIYEKTLSEGEECEPLHNGPQFGGCFVFETLPRGVTFNDANGDPAGVGGVCPAADVSEQARLARFAGGVTSFPAPGGPIEGFTCEEEVIGLNRMPGLLRGLARLVLPGPLHAKDLGETGTMGAFSTLFWAEPVAAEENPDSPLPTGVFAPNHALPLSFRIMTSHNHEVDTDPQPVGGVTVNFSIPAGAGSLSVPSDVSEVETGEVAVVWTLPAAAGDYTLTVSAPGLLNEDSVPVTLEFDVTVSATEMIVWNDVNAFDAIGMADADNQTLVQRFVNFTGTGSRAAGTKVLIDRGRSTGISAHVDAAFESELTDGTGITEILTITSSPGSLTSIDPAVKVVFLLAPEQAFTTAEVNVLKQFAADGGRIVLIGENNNFATALTVQNGLLAALGSSATNIGGRIDCGAHRQSGGGQLGTHAITSGLGGVTYTCMSALTLGTNDTALFRDDGLVNGDDQVQPVGRSTNPCEGDCVLAASVRISTTLTPVIFVASTLGAAGGFDLTSSSEPTHDRTTGIRR